MKKYLNIAGIVAIAIVAFIAGYYSFHLTAAPIDICRDHYRRMSAGEDEIANLVALTCSDAVSSRPLEAYSYRAVAYEKQGNTSGAASDFDYLINNHFLNILVSRAAACKTSDGNDDYDCIIKYMNMAIELDPKNLFERGRAYAEKGDSAAALADFAKYLEIKDNEPNSNVYYYEGRMSDQAGNYSLAIESYKKFLKQKGIDEKLAYEVSVRLPALALMSRNNYKPEAEKATAGAENATATQK